MPDETIAARRPGQEPVVLDEFQGGFRKPYVYLIWRKPSPKNVHPILVCIATKREVADRRVLGLNRYAEEWEYPWRYVSEPIPVDHLFAASELGVTIENLEHHGLEAQHRSAAAAAAGVAQTIEALRQRIIDLEGEIAQRDHNDRIVADARTRVRVGLGRDGD